MPCGVQNICKQHNTGTSHSAQVGPSDTNQISNKSLDHFLYHYQISEAIFGVNCSQDGANMHVITLLACMQASFLGHLDHFGVILGPS